LILWEVHYPVAWEVESPGWNRHQERYWDAVRWRAARRQEVARRLTASRAPSSYRPGHVST
jgi:hypothetical protein